MAKRVVIVGGGLGGLTAAVYARSAGHDVLLLEKQSQVGGKAAGLETHGYRLDPGPSIIILPETYERVFRDVGRDPAGYLTFHRLKLLSRVFMEGEEPLDLPSDRRECLDVLSRRYPEDAQNLQTLMARIDKIAPSVRRSVFARPIDRPWQFLSADMLRIGRSLPINRRYKDLVDGWFQSPLLRAFFYGFPSYGGQTYDSKAAGAFFIPYFMVQEGVFYPEGGVAAIPRGFEELARELGVDIRCNQTVIGLDLDGHRIRQVRTDNDDIPCDAVICNVDRYHAGKWLGRSFSGEPSLSYFTLHLGVRRCLDGLEHHNLFVPKDFECGFEQLYRGETMPDSPILYANVTNVTDPSTAPPHRTNLFLVATSPSSKVDWRESQDRIRHSLFATLAKFGYVVSDDELDFERVQSPLYFEAEHGNYGGSLYGPHERHRLYGMLPARNWDEQVPNLFYCGGSVQPGAGLPMVVLSGRFAAERLGRP